MSRKEESILEKILKPVRINPFAFGITFAGLSAYYLIGDPENSFIKVIKEINLDSAGAFFVFYIWGVKTYFKDRKILGKYGFDERYGKLRMNHYCDRQAFYVAGIEYGFRYDVRELIRRTPNEEKLFHYLPHI